MKVSTLSRHGLRLIVGLSLSFGACDSEKKDDEKKGAGAAFSSADAAGSWSTGCAVDEDTSSKTEVTLTSAGGVTGTSVVYEGTSCATKMYTYALTGTYKVGNDVTTPAGAKEFDMVVTGGTITLDSDTGVATFNSISLCDKTDWEKKSYNLADLTCPDLFELNATEYDIVKIDGNALYFGEEDSSHDGKTAAKRYVTLSTEKYTKQ